MKAVLYLMCSDGVKQDLEMQFSDMRRVCEANGWEYDEVLELCKGSQADQPKLREVIEQIRQKKYSVLIVHSLSKFSLEHPSRTYETLSRIVDSYRCRFLSLFEGIDSQDSLNWNKTMRLFAYFAHIFNRNLSIKAENGVKTKKVKVGHPGGRPVKNINSTRLKDSIRTGLTVRKALALYNAGLPRQSRISKTKMAKAMAEQGGMF